jgi:hypothetical protein
MITFSISVKRLRLLAVGLFMLEYFPGSIKIMSLPEQAAGYE